MINKYKQEILTVINSIKDEKLLDIFLLDLFTPKEYEEIIKRWQIVKQLKEGVTQRNIAKNLKISLSKITRGSRVLLDRNGGFNQILKAIRKKK